MKTTGFLLLVSTALIAWAQTPAAGQPVTATIDASKTGPPISPYVFGQFIEHAGSLIYSSLWSEMLDDTKFYYDVTNKPPEDPNAGQRGRGGGFGPGRRRNVGPGRWNPIGPVDSVVMDTLSIYELPAR
jgi:alpha-N-arabinofuranosidase